MKNGRLLFLLGILLFTTGLAYAQGDTTYRKEKASKKKVNSSFKLKQSSDRLIKSIDEEENKWQVAANYYALAQELIKTNEHAKAEGYLVKAIQQIQPDKSNNTLSAYYRELARVQELQKKNDAAAKSFELAALYTNDAVLKELNGNDAKRLTENATPQKKLDILQKNEEILNTKEGYSSERAQNYSRIADANKEMNKPEAAISNYNKALKEVQTGSYESKVISGSLATVLAGEKMYDSAIKVQQSILAPDSLADEDDALEMENMRKLAAIYFAKNNAAYGLTILNKAYRLSIKRNNLNEAKITLELLVDHYRKHNNMQQALRLYHGFIGNLDSLIARDSSLVDRKLFRYSEDKIAQLEKEKLLKDELIKRTNTSNSILIGSVILLAILLALIVRAWYAIRKRNKQIALQSLRREMNPHFLFNSLNSVNQFIASNNELEANKYLSAYSGLMRRIMENSNKDFIPLATELEQLHKYLELEQLRFPEKFSYNIVVDASLNHEAITVPNMIIQPHLENAIWHGLRYRETKGLLTVTFSKQQGKSQVTIEDNGIGYAQSQQLKTQHQKQYESRGLGNVEDRIRLLNELHGLNIRMNMVDKSAPDSGVITTINW